MKKVFKVLLIIIATLVVVVGIAALCISLKGIPKYPTQKINIKIESTLARIERGTKLASMLCRSRHYNDATNKFTGHKLTEAPKFEKIFSANITQGTIDGIGKWSDEDIIYLIRTGLKPDGQYIPPYMPKLVNICDEDLYSIVAFLGSDNKRVQPGGISQPPSQPSFLTKFLVTVAFKPFPYPSRTIPEPDTTNKAERGKYIGNPTEDQFIKAIKTGMVPNNERRFVTQCSRIRI